MTWGKTSKTYHFTWKKSSMWRKPCYIL